LTIAGGNKYQQNKSVLRVSCQVFRQQFSMLLHSGLPLARRSDGPWFELPLRKNRENFPCHCACTEFDLIGNTLPVSQKAKHISVGQALVLSDVA
jgi:hypothetical protein